MAKRRRVERTEPSRKVAAMTKQERERARVLTIVVGVVLGVTLLLLAAALLYQTVIFPQSAVASVSGEKISTKTLEDQTRFSQYQLINQLQNLIQFENQIDPGGAQGFFTSQKQQLRSQLANNESLTNSVMEEMIDNTLVRQLAAQNNIEASEAEITARLEALVASQQGFVTAPDATATAEALAAATATPSPTPSPTPTTTAGITLTAVLTPTATPEPTPTVHVQTADEYTTALDQLMAGISTGSGVSQATVLSIYRSLLQNEILTEKLQEKLGDQMPLEGEQVHARHILVSVATDASDADRELALAKAISITQRIKDGEDFATLAQQYSDDTGSGAQGGDLGFFGRGQMVTEFENAAFSLSIGQISEPVLSQFGYHIIEVLETNPGSPSFTAWLQEQKSQAQITRSLTAARIPNLPAINPALLTDAAVAATPTPIVIPEMTPSVATPAP
ncbi:MAG: peptidylprolyl isomerase [Caldilineales bacterium]